MGKKAHSKSLLISQICRTFAADFESVASGSRENPYQFLQTSADPSWTWLRGFQPQILYLKA